MNWKAQKGPQAEAIAATWARELFFGGARGGGKTDLLLADFLQDVPHYESNWQGILFRRTYPELLEVIRRSQDMYAPTGGEWYEQKKEWRWPNGACLRMAYLERTADATRYQGHQYTWIGWEELTQWPTDEGYRLLIACNRWTKASVPTKRIRSTGNPGGAGHHWVKQRFIDYAPKGYVPYLDPETKFSRIFIPSRVQDNKILMAIDPGYVDALRGVGSPEMVRAWLEGDWSVIAGAFFPEFTIAKHVIRPITLPSHWTRFRAADWGSSSPFSVLWFAVSDGTKTGDGHYFPPNSLICYREWYGGKDGVGLKMPVELVAKGIKERDGNDHISYSVLDPSAFKQDGGPSHGETFHRNGVYFRPADNTRIQGWEQVRSRLIGQDDTPMVYIFSTCPELIRTLPALQHDDVKIEDVNTEGDDHAPDAFRYGLMSRPYTRQLQTGKPRKTISELTFNEIRERHKAYR
jgi:hypothetical protein